PLVGILLPVLARLVALVLALLEVLLALILAFSQSLRALILKGLALLGGSEPRSPLVLLLPHRVAVELPGATSAGPVAARRPRLTPERAACGWPSTAVPAPAPALPQGAARRRSTARITSAARHTSPSPRDPSAASPAPPA